MEKNFYSYYEISDAVDKILETRPDLEFVKADIRTSIQRIFDPLTMDNLRTPKDYRPFIRKYFVDYDKIPPVLCAMILPKWSKGHQYIFQIERYDNPRYLTIHLDNIGGAHASYYEMRDSALSCG